MNNVTDGVQLLSTESFCSSLKRFFSISTSVEYLFFFFFFSTSHPRSHHCSVLREFKDSPSRWSATSRKSSSWAKFTSMLVSQALKRHSSYFIFFFLLIAVPSAHDSQSSLQSSADSVHVTTGDRESFLRDCRSGRFDGCTVAYRTIASYSITGQIDAEVVNALPKSLKFLASCGAYAARRGKEGNQEKDKDVRRCLRIFPYQSR